MMSSVYIKTFSNIIIPLLLLSISSGCSNKKQEQKPPVVPVRAGNVIQMNIPVQITSIGTVQASVSVSIKSLVSGEIRGIYFKEGQDVKKNQLLFRIDTRPYYANLKQAQAQLAQDIAQARAAADQAERNRVLAEKDYVSKDQYNQLRAKADALAAQVDADRARVDYARLQLSYCMIRSPIDGTAGNTLIDLGNAVKENDVPMLTVNKVSPIDIIFSIPEQYLSEVRKFASAGDLKMEAIIPGNEKNPPAGKLRVINNQVDAETGTIQLKGEFANTDKRLWPGQFVNVILTLSVQENAVVIPSMAVQASQQGQYAFVIRKDSTVERRNIKIVRTYNDLSIIEKGAVPGERVVTDGQLQLVPGAKVEIQPSAGKESAGSMGSAPSGTDTDESNDTEEAQ